MAEVVVIDTDISIDVSRGNETAIVYLQNLTTNGSLAVSLITQMELLVGCRNKQEIVLLDKFLKRFQMIKLNEAISIIAVDLLRQYRLSHGLLMPDALIAATALSLNSGLATKNQRDYRFIDSLKLLTF
jgi:predicted nucleic acid-binding protein